MMSLVTTSVPASMIRTKSRYGVPSEDRAGAADVGADAGMLRDIQEYAEPLHDDDEPDERDDENDAMEVGTSRAPTPSVFFSRAIA